MRSSSLWSSASTGVAALLILVLVCPATIAATVEANGFAAPAVGVVLGRDAPREWIAAAELCRVFGQPVRDQGGTGAGAGEIGGGGAFAGQPPDNPAGDCAGSGRLASYY